MYNSRLTVGSRARRGSTFKVSLGNTAVRYNSDVDVQRRKYFMSSGKNSEDAPDWMSRTQTHHFRDHNRNRSLFVNPSAPFKVVKQTYVYAGLTRPLNPEAQFDRVVAPRQRTKWEMKNHTFQLDWPKPEAQLKTRSAMSMHESTGQVQGSKAGEATSRQAMPKYGYFQSPLHFQKDTPIKIGHPYLLNSTYVK